MSFEFCWCSGIGAVTLPTEDGPSAAGPLIFCSEEGASGPGAGRRSGPWWRGLLLWRPAAQTAENLRLVNTARLLGWRKQPGYERTSREATIYLVFRTLCWSSVLLQTSYLIILTASSGRWLMTLYYEQNSQSKIGFKMYFV